jgi:hypothetical protein
MHHFDSAIRNVSCTSRFAAIEEVSLATKCFPHRKKRAQSEMRKAMAICSREAECDRE